MAFCKQFNARTQGKGDMLIPVVITVHEDRSFLFITKSPPASVLLKKAAKIKSGSKMPQKDKVGKIRQDDIKKIAEIKLPDLNCMDIESACSQIVGTARSMGLEVLDT